MNTTLALRLLVGALAVCALIETSHAAAGAAPLHPAR